MRLWLNRTWGHIPFLEKQTRTCWQTPSCTGCSKPVGRPSSLLDSSGVGRFEGVTLWDHNFQAEDRRAELTVNSKACVSIQCPPQRGHVILLFDKCGVLLSKWNLFQTQGCWAELIPITLYQRCEQSTWIQKGQIPRLQQICVLKTDTVLNKEKEKQKKGLVKHEGIWKSWGLEVSRREMFVTVGRKL